MSYQDPLWKLRHALAGVALALVLAVLTAAFAGRVLGDLFVGSYGARVAFYGALDERLSIDANGAWRTVVVFRKRG